MAWISNFIPVELRGVITQVCLNRHWTAWMSNYITQKARDRTCRDACRDRQPAVSLEGDGGENVPSIPAQPAILRIW